MSKKEIIIVFILITITCVRFLFFIPNKPNYDSLIGRNVSFKGVVIENPDVRLKNKNIKINISNTDYNILVVVNKNTNISYGDFVEVGGVLKEPENFITNSGKEFNYKRYLANQDIYYIVKNAEIKTISIDNGNKIKKYLYKIKDIFLLKINNIIPYPESELAAGLLLGVRGGFDDETKNNFIETGTIHIIALSGYNISIIGLGVINFLKIFVSQTISTVFGFIIVLLFILMTGASATAVRAGIMASIMLLGNITGRKYIAGRALFIAGILMIVYDPRVITDLSFQLSFIATFGVLFITPKIFNWFKFITIRFGLREMVASTFAATIAVTPIIIQSTGFLSLVSIPVNLLILSFIPVAMLTSFVSIVFGFVSYNISLFFGYFADLILSYILSVINYIGSFSFASVTIQEFPLIVTIIIYILLVWWVYKEEKKV